MLPNYCIKCMIMFILFVGRYSVILINLMKKGLKHKYYKMHMGMVLQAYDNTKRGGWLP